MSRVSNGIRDLEMYARLMYVADGRVTDIARRHDMKRAVSGARAVLDGLDAEIDHETMRFAAHCENERARLCVSKVGGWDEVAQWVTNKLAEYRRSPNGWGSITIKIGSIDQ